jgi:hypothetical protein
MTTPIIKLFNEWWYSFGSGIIPLKDHDMEEHGKRIAEIAFESGFMAGRRNGEE